MNSLVSLRLLAALAGAWFVVSSSSCGGPTENTAIELKKNAVDYNPEIVQFRIVARPGRHTREIERAAAQQAAETDAGREWSDVVLSGNSTNKPIAQWFTVRVDRQADFSMPDTVKRSLPPRPDGSTVVQLLVVNDPMNVNRSHINYAAPGLDANGKPCVLFSLNPEGAKRMMLLSSSALPEADGSTYCLAIILDGIIMGAPAVRGAISDHGEITGDFSRQQVDEMAAILNAIQLNDAPTIP